MDYNKLIIMGNVGGAPEFKEGDNWRIAKFSVCTNRRYKRGDQHVEEQTWHRVVVYNKHLVELTERFINKGTKVLIEGRLQIRKYEANGETRYATECVVDRYEGHIVLAGSKKGDEGARGESRQASDSAPFDDDIPF